MILARNIGISATTTTNSFPSSFIGSRIHIMAGRTRRKENIVAKKEVQKGKPKPTPKKAPAAAGGK